MASVSCVSSSASIVSNTRWTMSSTDISVRSCWVRSLFAEAKLTEEFLTGGGLSDLSVSATAGLPVHAGTGALA